jgi:CRISPR/Cas system-associated exonuclease Cas4 (RecB family)
MIPKGRKGGALRRWRQQKRGGAWIPPPRADRPDLGASELAGYCFCPRSWWLRRIQRVEGESGLLSAGTWTHRKLGLTVAEAVAMERVVRVCVGLLLGIAGAVMGLWMNR